jgi:hypothetical protein
MRRGWMLLLGMIVVAYLALDAIVSTLTLEDFATRPVTGFVRETEGGGMEGRRLERVRLARETDFFGAQAAGTVRPAGGAATLLGYRRRYRLPSGAVFACTHILRWMWCEGGWQAERAAATAGR